MKRIAMALTAVMCLASVASAQEVGSNHQYLKDLDYFVGQWTETGQWNLPGEEPHKFTYLQRFNWTLGKNFLSGTTMQTQEDGTSVVVHKSMIGWEPDSENSDKGTITGWGFWLLHGGKSEQVEFIKQGDNKWVVEREGLRGEFNLIDKDKYEYSAEFTRDDGTKGSWSLTAVRNKPAKANLPAPIRKELAYHVGQWSVKGNVGDKPLSGLSTVRWAPGRHMLKWDATWNDPDGEAITGSGAMGWDAVNERMHILEFWSSGWSHHRRYEVTSKGVWEADSDGVNDEGQSVTAKVKQEVLDKEHFVWRSTNNMIGGEPGPDVEIHFRRIKD